MSKKTKPKNSCPVCIPEEFTPDPRCNYQGSFAEIYADREDDLWSLYSLGYKMAGDTLIDCIEKGSASSYLIYPILFSYRQYIELRLKQILLECDELSEGPFLDQDKKDIIFTKHDLPELWNTCKEVLIKLGIYASRSVDPLPSITSIIDCFSKMDHGSYNFRYPVDTKGDTVYLGDYDMPIYDKNNSKIGHRKYPRPVINLVAIKETMMKLDSHLSGILEYINISDGEFL